VLGTRYAEVRLGRSKTSVKKEVEVVVPIKRERGVTGTDSLGPVQEVDEKFIGNAKRNLKPREGSTEMARKVGTAGAGLTRQGLCKEH